MPQTPVSDILAFLRELANNNNRDWFQAHKAWYDRCHAAFVQLTDEYITLLQSIDPALAGLQPKDCIWRIYRDVRFSANKNPYKEWFGTFPAAPAPGKPNTGGKHSMRGGYYLHLQPGHCLFAGGIWCPNPDLLRALRQEVAANWDEIDSIMATPSWQRYFGDFDTEWMLKKVPQGFDLSGMDELTATRVGNWIKRKAFTFSTPLTDDEVCAPDFMTRLADICRAAKPMNDFLNYTFEEYGEFPSIFGR